MRSIENMLTDSGKSLRSFLLLIICLTGFGWPTMAQSHLSPGSLATFQRREDSIKKFAFDIVNDSTPGGRFRADSQFIRSLVRVLKLPNSFYYPFDSLQTISHLYAPDSSFRIFTWQFQKDNMLYLQEGAIQMNQPDGSLKLFPLFDCSMFTARPLDSVRTRLNWIGAIYYRIVEKTWQGRKYYTLLGFDDYTETANKKWMEVLTFTPQGEPRFGGPYFSFQEDSVPKPTQYRFDIEYKKEAGTRFNYDPSLDLIVYDELISENNQPQKKDTYVPDGDFEAFQWKDGKWVHMQKGIVTIKLKDGDFPREAEILNDQGKANEEVLQSQSEKNKKKTPPHQ